MQLPWKTGGPPRPDLAAGGSEPRPKPEAPIHVAATVALVLILLGALTLSTVGAGTRVNGTITAPTCGDPYSIANEVVTVTDPSGELLGHGRTGGAQDGPGYGRCHVEFSVDVRRASRYVIHLGRYRWPATSWFSRHYVQGNFLRLNVSSGVP